LEEQPMTTNMQDIIKRVQAIAPPPHTVAAPMDDRAVIVGSNGRVLGWVATTSGDWRAVAELWTLAPTIVQAVAQRNAVLEADNARLRALLVRGAELMPPEQLSQWEGVRAELEAPHAE
jgi:hypothetical protein